MLGIFATGMLLMLGGDAGAGSVVCPRVADGALLVDGMLDDWQGVRGVRAAGKDADASFALRCGYDRQRLYLAVDVRDQELVRRAGGREDQLELVVQVPGKAPLRLVARPGTKRHRPVRRLGKRRPPAWLELEDTRQPHGFSLEVSWPLQRMAGFGRHSFQLQAQVRYRDVDGGQRPAAVRFEGTLELAEGRALVRSFLRETGLERSELRLDAIADVDGDGASERILAGGATIGVLSDRYVFMTLPAAPAEVKNVQVVELRGDGTSHIVAQYREHGGGGSRDVVSIWSVSGRGRFERVLAFEVGKRLGSRSIANTWRLTPRAAFRAGKRSRRGHDIVVEVGAVEGWDQESFLESPATDMRPILTPWGEQRSAVYWLEGDAVLGGEPMKRR